MPHTRRFFIVSCWTILATAGMESVDARQPVNGWEKAVDAYLAGNLSEAARVLELSSAAIRDQSPVAFDAWMRQAHSGSGGR